MIIMITNNGDNSYENANDENASDNPNDDQMIRQ